jgi:PadR family transcriptional regulator PadR
MSGNVFVKRVVNDFLDYIVLSAAVVKKPVYGYELMCKIKQLFGVIVSPSTLYPLLSKLEKEEHLTSEWILPKNGNGKPQKMYYITCSGEHFRCDLENGLTVFMKKLETLGSEEA